jgi:uncharacterized membrane protein
VTGSVYDRPMRIATLVMVGLLVAAAITLTQALVTRDGVGIVEYVIGFAVVAGLLYLAFARSRRTLRSR